TPHTPSVCTRVSGATIRGPSRARQRPQATTASTPDTPTASAGKNAADGVSSEIVASISGAWMRRRRHAPEIERSEEHTSELQPPGRTVCRLQAELKNVADNVRV